MAYESPIDLTYESDTVIDKLNEHIEKGIMEAVTVTMGINVDKIALQRALAYDRGQYDKGFEDGRTEALYDSIYTIVWYNGYKDEIVEWIQKGDEEFPKGEDGYHTVHAPFSDREDYDDEMYGQVQAIWMMLVREYGDYGTSPRFGWITDWNACKALLERVVKQIDENETYIY